MKVCRITLKPLNFRNTIKMLKMRPVPYKNFLNKINASQKMKTTQPFGKNLTSCEQNTKKVRDN